MFIGTHTHHTHMHMHMYMYAYLHCRLGLPIVSVITLLILTTYEVPILQISILRHRVVSTMLRMSKGSK